MGNKVNFFVLLLLMFVANTLYCQNKFVGKYIELSQFENEDFLESNFKEGKYYLIRRENNKIKEIQIRNYQNSKKQGEWLVFIQTFKGLDLVNVSNYKNDNLDGYFFSTDNHTESKEGYYKAGRKHGQWEIIEVSGGYAIKSEGQYKNGKKHDRWIKTESTNEGKIITTGIYKNGKKNGIWETKDYTTKPPFIIKKYYKKGKLIKTE